MHNISDLSKPPHLSLLTPCLYPPSHTRVFPRNARIHTRRHTSRPLCEAPGDQITSVTVSASPISWKYQGEKNLVPSPIPSMLLLGLIFFLFFFLGSSSPGFFSCKNIIMLKDYRLPRDTNVFGRLPRIYLQIFTKRNSVLNGFWREAVGRNEKQVATHQIFSAKGATCHPAAVVFWLFSCSWLFETQRMQFSQDCLSVATSWSACKLTVVARVFSPKEVWPSHRNFLERESFHCWYEGRPSELWTINVPRNLGNSLEKTKWLNCITLPYCDIPKLLLNQIIAQYT